MITLKETSGNEANAKSKNKWTYILLLVGIFLLLLSHNISPKIINKDEKCAVFQRENSEEQKVLKTTDIEEDTAKILSKINGVGKVDVKINWRGTSEKILAKDLTTVNESKSEEKIRSEENQKTVMESKNANQTPFVLSEKAPKIEGILIVAEGANEEKILNEIHDAIKALFDVAPHRIKISAARK